MSADPYPRSYRFPSYAPERDELVKRLRVAADLAQDAENLAALDQIILKAVSEILAKLASTRGA